MYVLFGKLATRCLRAVLIAAVASSVSFGAPQESPGPPRKLTLDEAISMAMTNSRRRPASHFEVAMAEAQHRQALAGYWPQVGLTASLQRLDQPLNFIFPASTFAIPPQSVTVPGGAALVTIPAGSFFPGFPAADVQMPVSYPGQTINTPAQAFRVPEQDVKVTDRNVVLGNLDLKWLLVDGGMRKGYRQQSGGWLDMMKQEARRTDLEIADTVRRYYWGSVLTRQVRQVAADTLARMDVTLQLTETMYKEGAGKVTKADYQDAVIMVESLRSMVAQLEKNEQMAKAALANAAGLPWTDSIEPAASEIPFQPPAGGLEEAVGTSYRFNPDWGKLEAAIRAAEGVATTARSGYFPKIALTGTLHRWWNGDYRGGLATTQNITGWTAGVGLEFPIFDGFLTRNKVAEARARVEQLKQMQFLLHEGLGLQIKDIWFGIEAAAKSFEATKKAMDTAVSNRDLNERAYQSELVETDKVIRAQLVEALMSAQHFKTRYDHATGVSQLNLVVGAQIRQALGAAK
jgi:outer membrane protein